MKTERTQLSENSIKLILFGVEIAIIFFAFAFASCILYRLGSAPFEYIDKFANIGLKVLTITAITAFASDIASGLIKDKSKDE